MKILMILLIALFGRSPLGTVDKERCAFVYSEPHEPQEISLTGNVRIVDIGETFRVRIVDVGEDIKVVTAEFPSQCGEWRFVDVGEDFSVRFVDIGEDFTIRLADF